MRQSCRDAGGATPPETCSSKPRRQAAPRAFRAVRHELGRGGRRALGRDVFAPLAAAGSTSPPRWSARLLLSLPPTSCADPAAGPADPEPPKAHCCALLWAAVSLGRGLGSGGPGF